VSELEQPTNANAPMTSDTINSFETVLIAYLLIAFLALSPSIGSVVYQHYGTVTKHARRNGLRPPGVFGFPY
jgi:cell division protein FtsL